MFKTIIPENKEHWLEMRSKNISSTEIASLFGIGKYSTPFELWNQKKGNYTVAFEGNERSEWGLALQDSIAAKFAKDNNLNIRRMDEYIFDDVNHIGASFDFAIDNDGLIEVKNVDGIVFKNEWSENSDGALEAPMHIEAQIQQELYCSQRKYCWLVVLVGGNKLVSVKRTRDEAVISAILEKVSEFWRSIESNTPPDPNFEADAEFIGKLFGYAEHGKVLNIFEDSSMTLQAHEYKRLGDIVKDATEKRDAIKAEFLTKISDAEKCIGNGFSIDCGITAGAHIEFDRAPFRRFKISWKKQK